MGKERGEPFYITTTLPYVNAAPHIGFALEIVQADVVARYRRAQGGAVVFNTGTDEHGLKIFRAAQAEKKDPQAYADEWAAKFDRLKGALDLSYTDFIRTTDTDHMAAAQEFWRRCAAAGDIYKKTYQVKYCVGCELEKTDSELMDGKCPIHPTTPLELIDEENYFFKFSKYGKPLLALYEGCPDFVVPATRLTEIREFVKRGLTDFSVSRLKEKMPWGVPVPGDPAHVMYVWFDALVNYISTLGWPSSAKATEGRPTAAKTTEGRPSRFEEFWGTAEKPKAVQCAGKDNLRQQSAMWQAMLMSAGLPPSRQILIHGFITSGGQKMSKSVGNVVDPFALVERYGTDAVRYWLLREMSPFEDGDFTEEKFAERYTADLANGIGNLVSRVAALGEKCGVIALAEGEMRTMPAPHYYDELMRGYRFNELLQRIWGEIQSLDRSINAQKLWEQEGRILEHGVVACALSLLHIARQLEPFLPGTVQRIRETFSVAGGKLTCKKGKPLFPRVG